MPLPRLVAALSLAAVLGCDVASMAGPDAAAVDLTASAEEQALPLIFVDGRRLARLDLQRIAREDIVSIEILKSPAATSRYGPAARAGVIHISTRAGR
jgi:outer membrane receptor for ferrienterochelin and colicin